jgi:hypothetical protein
MSIDEGGSAVARRHYRIEGLITTEHGDACPDKRHCVFREVIANCEGVLRALLGGLASAAGGLHFDCALTGIEIGARAHLEMPSSFPGGPKVRAEIGGIEVDGLVAKATIGRRCRAPPSGRGDRRSADGTPSA